MKYIRKFDSAAAMAAALATLERPFVAWDGATSTTNLEFGEETNVPTESPTTEAPITEAPAIGYTVPFYIEDASGEQNEVQIINEGSSETIDLSFTVETSTDGKNWSTLGTSSTISHPTLTTVVPANGKLYLRCNTNAWYLIVATRALPVTQRANAYITATKNFNIGGNINSLLYGSSFNGQVEFPSGCESSPFSNLFAPAVDPSYTENNKLVDASNLMLPATTLINGCYSNMFQNCTSLTTAPALPATTLAANCYSSMFTGCTSLTTAPALPATTLVDGCYASMFWNCSNLTTAPDLPATTLVQGCYHTMFRQCSKLNSIKCLATDISADNCTNYWLYNTNITGIFTKAASMSSWPTGTSGIPSGWTVEDAA